LGEKLLVTFVGSGIAGIWKVFVKAGQPGWASIIPIYTSTFSRRSLGKPAWWVVLFLIPFVNVIIAILLSIELAKVFGKSAGFGIGLALLGFVFYPILGFGDAQFQGKPAQA